MWKKTVLILGGAGFIGTNLARYLLARNYRVRVLDDLSRGRGENLIIKGLAEVLTGSILDAALLDAAIDGADVVVNAVCRPITDAIAHPNEGFLVNAYGAHRVAEACLRRGTVLIHLSSVSVYGARKHDLEAIAEDDLVLDTRRDLYAAAKLAGELAVRALRDAHPGWSAMILRPSNVYGPHQHPDDPHTGVVPRFIRAALTGAPVRIFGDGDRVRDYTFVDDVCAAIFRGVAEGVPSPVLQPAREDAAWSAQPINIASGEGTSTYRLLHAIGKHVGAVPAVRYEPPRPSDIAYRRVLSVERAMRSLHWCPTTSLDQGLAKTVAWVQSLR